MEQKKPSEVFLELWQQQAPDQSSEKFAECAAAWRQIMSLEEIYAEAQRREQFNAIMAHVMEDPSPAGGLVRDDGTPHPSAAPTPSPQGEGVEEARSEADTGGPEEDPSPAAQDDRSEVSAAGAAAAKVDAARRGVITRKRRAMERLDALRAAGYTRAQIADAGRGLTVSDVMDALDRKELALPKLAALEKAMAKLEAEQQSASSETPHPPAAPTSLPAGESLPLKGKA